MTDSPLTIEQYTAHAACPDWCTIYPSCSDTAGGDIHHEADLARSEDLDVVLATWIGLDDGSQEGPYASLFLHGKGTDTIWSAEQLRAAADVLKQAADRMDAILR